MQGEGLRAARKAMGMTQDDLASALDLSKNFISMMERGTKAVDRRTALAVAWLVEHPEARDGDCG